MGPCDGATVSGDTVVLVCVVVGLLPGIAEFCGSGFRTKCVLREFFCEQSAKSSKAPARKRICRLTVLRSLIETAKRRTNKLTRSCGFCLQRVSPRHRRLCAATRWLNRTANQSCATEVHSLASSLRVILIGSNITGTTWILLPPKIVGRISVFFPLFFRSLG